MSQLAMNVAAPSRRRKILWLATADARGHVMRAQLLARALIEQGVDVDVVTTSAEGAAFLAAFGVRADVVSPHYRVEFDDRHNMARLHTDLRIGRYVVDPTRMRRDLGWLARRSRGADLVVNDSNHPALLFAPLFAKTRHLRIVHVYGQNLRVALESNFAGRGPAIFDRTHAGVVRRLLEKGTARIEHTFAVSGAGAYRGGGNYHLPPVVAPPARAAADVRRQLGVGPRDRLAVAYLNPHFRDPELAHALEEAIDAAGFKLHAIGEGYPSRPRWRGCDAALSDVIAASDLFISGAGMGALAQARAFGVPLLSMVSDQPEQSRNVAFLRDAGHPYEVVPLNSDRDDVRRQLKAAIASLTRPSGSALHRSNGRDGIVRTCALWVDVLQRLLHDTPPQEPCAAVGEIGQTRSAALATA